MSTQLKRLAALCAGTLLFACAHLGQRLPFAPSPSELAQSAEEAYLAGRTAHLAHRFEAAAASYQAALQADPAHVNARNGMAILHVERGDFGKAIELWRALTSTAAGPEQAFLFSNLGYAHFLNGRYEEAVAALEQACMLDPLNQRAWQHLGGALDKLGQHERARQMYRQARALRKHDFKADYKVAPRAGVAAIDNAVQAAVDTTQWDVTEVRETASGMHELRRVPARRAETVSDASIPVPAPEPAPAAVAPDVPAAPESTVPKAQLEIRNGNGVPGMARLLSLELDRSDMHVVRLSNQKGFNVERTRVEYQGGFQDAAARLAGRLGNPTVVEVDDVRPADLRLVVGRDMLPGKLAARPSARLRPASFVQHQTRPVRSRDNEADQFQIPGAQP